MGIFLTAVAIGLGIAMADLFRRIMDWTLDMIAELAGEAAATRMGNNGNGMNAPMMNQGDMPVGARPLGPQASV